MNSKLRWIMPMLVVGSLMAGCQGTVSVKVVTPAPGLNPPSLRLLPSSSEPDLEPNPPVSLPSIPTPILGVSATPTSIPRQRVSATQAPTPLPLSTAVPTALPLAVTQGPALRVPRMWHTATRLADGRILLAGGSRAKDDFLADVDIFDPATGQTSQVAPLHKPRHAHTATLLPDGRVLVVGGYALPWQWLDDAEVYDLAANTWTVVPPLSSHGVTHTATLLKDGRVLVAGGNIDSGRFTERVEIFDPHTNTWSEARPLPGERAGHVAQLLENGEVLVAGGQTNVNGLVGDAMLYDRLANTWTVTGPMVKPRLLAQSVRLQDGRVLVAGGMTLQDMPANKLSASAEIYDPASRTWTAAAAMSQPRYSHFLAPLPDGQVLAFAGARDMDCCWTDDSFVREIERYDPVANTWQLAGELPQPRAQASATFLQDGRIWLAGGRWSYTMHGADSWLISAPL